MRAEVECVTALLFSSIWFEGMPVVLAATYTTVLRAISNQRSAMTGLIMQEENGLHAGPGDADGFRNATGRITSAPEFAANLRRNARHKQRKVHSTNEFKKYGCEPTGMLKSRIQLRDAAPKKETDARCRL